MAGEFDIIRRYFEKRLADASVTLGIGDDAAVIDSKDIGTLVATTDMLVADVHFPSSVSARSIGHRALAVNLSDLAAMGAVPRWALLQLSVPDADENWLDEFSAGLFALAGQHEVSLVGGDTVQGPLCIGMTLLGSASVPVRRDGARAGDTVFVSGTVGDAFLGLQRLKGDPGLSETDGTVRKFLYPQPQVELGRALVGTASAMIDTSDGLLTDLEKLLVKSECGATIDIDAIPLSEDAVSAVKTGTSLGKLLNGGDDYELCFTARPEKAEAVHAISVEQGVAVTAIGQVNADSALRFVHQGKPWQPGITGFEHFDGKNNA